MYFSMWPPPPRISAAIYHSSGNTKRLNCFIIRIGIFGPVSYPSTDNKFFSSQKRPEGIWVRPSPYAKSIGALTPEFKGPGSWVGGCVK